MKHIKTVSEPCLRQSLTYGGCGECQSPARAPAKPAALLVTRAVPAEQQILAGRDGKTNHTASK